ncbi:MAG: glutamate-cysteine ligase family protein [Bdellovibrionales bacterium]|nr:glutamate-cysteine ligase family protein [Bdellovibrionales bacterium]
MKNLKLFEGYGIESEYMIVNKSSLMIEHFTEYLLKIQNKDVLQDEIEYGDVCWSNELVDHVIEIKCNGPQLDLKTIEQNFYQSVKMINQHLKSKNAILMPSSMHPFMDPDKDMQLWPHGQKEVYKKYHEIFNCTGHGWSNLQSVHINLPYSTEAEFERLHAAIRMVLPFVSYLSASSPAFEQKIQGVPDNRLNFYELNQKKVPSITGQVIPEPLFTFEDYHKKLKELYKDISQYDPDKVLQHQWLNSRGAIVKFDVKAIEIRTMDIQESPYMDFSLIAFFVAWLKSLVSESLVNLSTQRSVSTETLRSVYDQANSYTNHQILSEYRQLYPNHIDGENFNQWLESLYNHLKPDILAHYHQGIELILNEGNLSKRIKKASESHSLESIYKNLTTVLNENDYFKL